MTLPAGPGSTCRTSIASARPSPLPGRTQESAPDGRAANRHPARRDETVPLWQRGSEGDSSSLHTSARPPQPPCRDRVRIALTSWRPCVSFRIQDDARRRHTDRAALPRAARLMTRARDAFYERRYEECIERCQETLAALLPRAADRRARTTSPPSPDEQADRFLGPVRRTRCRWSRRSASPASSPSSCAARRGSATSGAVPSPGASGGSSCRSPARRPPRCSPRRATRSRPCSAAGAGRRRDRRRPGAARPAPRPRSSASSPSTAQSLLASEVLVIFNGSELSARAGARPLAARSAAPARSGGLAASARRPRRGPLAFAAVAAIAALSLPVGVLGAALGPRLAPARARAPLRGARTAALAALAVLAAIRPPRAGPGSRSSPALARRRRGPGARVRLGGGGRARRRARSLALALIGAAWTPSRSRRFSPPPRSPRPRCILALRVPAPRARLLAGGARRAGAPRSRSPAPLGQSRRAQPGGALARPRARWRRATACAATSRCCARGGLVDAVRATAPAASPSPTPRPPRPSVAPAAARRAGGRAGSCSLDGAFGGALAEALKHPVEQVDYLESDPGARPLVRPHLPAGAGRGARGPARPAAPRGPAVVAGGQPRPVRRGAPRRGGAGERACQPPRDPGVLRPRPARRSAGGRASLRSLSAAPRTTSAPSCGCATPRSRAPSAAAFPGVAGAAADNPLTLLGLGRDRGPAPTPGASPRGCASAASRHRTLAPEVIRGAARSRRAACAAARTAGDAGGAENRDAAPAAYLYHVLLPRSRRRPRRRGLAGGARRSRRWWVFALPALDRRARPARAAREPRGRRRRSASPPP